MKLKYRKFTNEYMKELMDYYRRLKNTEELYARRIKCIGNDENDFIKQLFSLTLREYIALKCYHNRSKSRTKV